MALQLWETLKDSITVYTGLSPAAFFTVLALGLAVYYAVSSLFGSSDDGHMQQRSRGFEEDVQPLPPPVQLGEITAEELKQYDGSDSKKPLLMAIKGQIYDVSQSRMFYGPGGPYALFAGKDASRALAKMSFEESDLNGDLTGLGVFELDALQDWEYKFMSKYVKVGTLKQTENHSSQENAADQVTTDDQTDLASKPEESAAHSEVVEPVREGSSSKSAENESGETVETEKKEE